MNISLTPVEPSTGLDYSGTEWDSSPVEDSTVFTYASLPIARAPAASKFAYPHIGRSFVEKDTNTTYRITDIVTVASPLTTPTACVKFYDVSLYSSPYTDSDLYEYESIQDFFSDANYVFSSISSAPTRPNARVRKINMLKAKIATNINDHPMSIGQALRHKYASEFMAAFADEI